jgi:DNA-binding winged helix-turn-helix (wHTH) protein/Tol biopolymer transport system component
MGPKPHFTPRLVFGPFEYDPASEDLLRNGLRIRLHGQPRQILARLLERPGEIISREDLRSYLWPGTAFVDFEQGLNAAVNKLRQALGDAAAQPRYVETVPGRGYRFIAHVHTDSANLVASGVGSGSGPVLEFDSASARHSLTVVQPEIAEVQPQSAQTLIGRWQWIGGAVAAIAVVSAASYWLGSRNAAELRLPSNATPIRFVITPPPGFAIEGAHPRQAFALSPDGLHLAMLAKNAAGGFSTWIREISSVTPRQLAGTEGSHTLFWSTDSRALYVVVRGKLRRYPIRPAEGGEDSGSASSVEICDIPPFMYYGTALRDGSLLLAGRKSTMFVPYAPSSQVPQLLRKALSWPHALPTGNLLLQGGWNAAGTSRQATIQQFHSNAAIESLATSQPVRLVDTDSRVVYAPSPADQDRGHLLYLRAGSLLAQPFDVNKQKPTGEAISLADVVTSFRPVGAADFSVSDTGLLAFQTVSGRSQLAWVDRAGHVLETVGPANASLKSARISPDGRKVATAIYDPSRGAQALWIIDTKSKAARLLSADHALRDAPAWSPDSSQLLFIRSAGEEVGQLAIRGLGATDPERSIRSADFKAPTDWSPDGKYVVFGNSGYPRFANDIQGDVLLARASGGEFTPLLHSPFHEANAMFSPDGRWLAFTSNESGRTELYVQQFDDSGKTPRITGERLLASSAGAQVVRWRRDGKELFYLGFDGWVYSVPILSSSGQTLSFGKPAPLFAISLDALTAIHCAPGFDVSADGQRFIIAVANEPGSGSITVVQNWQAGLGAVAAHQSH